MWFAQARSLSTETPDQCLEKYHCEARKKRTLRTERKKKKEYS